MKISAALPLLWGLLKEQWHPVKFLLLLGFGIQQLVDGIPSGRAVLLFQITFVQLLAGGRLGIHSGNVSASLKALRGALLILLGQLRISFCKGLLPC